MSHARPVLPSKAPGVSSRRDSQSEVETSNKRKRTSTTKELPDLPLGGPFVIYPYPKSIYDKPSTFTPIQLISRSQLPLTYLDTSSTTNPSNRFFSAHIDVLEREHAQSDHEPKTPKILITRNGADSSLYAVERVQQDVYGLCKLVSWLKEQDVARMWDMSMIIVTATRRLIGRIQSGEEWWKAAAIEGLEKPLPEEKTAKRMRVSMLRPKTPSLEAPKPGPMPNGPITQETFQNSPVEAAEMAPEEPLSSQQICENLVSQYLDALYLSKTSLAYFVKGPMSRARVAFTSGEESGFTIYGLATFLRSCLLSHSAVDKKYREKLQEVVKSIPPGSYSDDENSPNKPKKAKKPKKVKLNRDGMYPREEEYVKKWWRADTSILPSYGEETLEQRLKKRVGDLRIRETLAQLIFMLEILALEVLPAYKELPPSDETVDAETQTQLESDAKPKKKRKKKVQDIKLLIDLLLDKLCIWQSVEQDEDVSYLAKGSKFGDTLDANSSKSASGDRLQNFCIEVIVPFYMSRLPEQAATINKRLGGPVAASPAKRKATKPPPTSRKSGEPSEPDTKKRRTLARVATDTMKQAPHRPTLGLSRSATDSALLPRLKREASEVPLSVIPFQRSPSTASNRQALTQFNRLSKREVDLTTKSATALAKISRQKRVEEELKEAISTLKKPQRGLAVSGYVEDAEKRGLGSTNWSRKPANPTRKILQNVQVTATPRRVRKNDAHIPFRGYDDPPPSSSTTCIPSSAVRPSAARPFASVVPGTEIRRTAPVVSHGVAETPSRGPGRKVSFFNIGPSERQLPKGPAEFRLPEPTSDNRNVVNGVVPYTPSKPKRRQTLESENAGPAAIFATPLKSSSTSGVNIARPDAIVNTTPLKSSSVKGLNIARPEPTVFTTPVRKLAMMDPGASFHKVEKAAPARLGLGGAGGVVPQAEEKEKSIYDVLGWDDDDDLL